MLRWIFEAIRYPQKNDKAKKMISQNFYQIHQLVDGSGCTVLHTAADSRNFDIISFIFSYYGQKQQAEPGIFGKEKLIEWVNRVDKQGFIALHYAVFRHEMRIVNLLQRNGADIYSTSGDGLNCLHLAAQGGSPLLMYYFMGKGMKIGSIDSKGNTPLHWAAYSGMEFSVSACLAWGAEIDTQEHINLMTPLHLGVISGNTRVIKKLLLAGCDREITNKKGLTARQLALQKGYFELLQILDNKFKVLEFLNIEQTYQPHRKKGFPYYFFIVSFLMCFGINIFYLFPLSSGTIDLLTYINIGIGTVLVILFLSISFSNPGILKAKDDLNFIKLLRAYNPKRICYDCSIVRPIRSRHCTICKKCVCVYDHHCPWVGNCIGANNYLRFFMFLLSLVVYLIYNIGYHINNIFDISISEIHAYVVMKIVASAVNLLFASIFIIPIIYLLFIQIGNALSDKTTFQKYSQVGKFSNKQKKINMEVQTQLKDKISLTSGKRSIYSGKQTQSEQIAQDQSGYLANCCHMLFTNKENRQYTKVQ